MHHRARLITASSVAVLALLVSVSPAFATFWGGSWSYPAGGYSALILNYVDQTGSDSNISTAVSYASVDWSGTRTPVAFESQTSGSIVVNIVQSLPNGWDGATYLYGSGVPGSPANCSSPCDGSNNYSSATISLLKSGFDNSSPSVREILAEHEFGHSIGLGHADGTGCSSIMYSNTVNNSHETSKPSGYDQYNINTLYPNKNYPPVSSC